MSLLLIEWSLRRVRDVLSIYFRIARLTVDWTTIVYLYLPALALLIYEGIHYYRGMWFTGMAPDTPLVGPVTYRMIVMVITFILMFLLHISVFGHISFPLRSGDRAFVLSSPIAKDIWFWTIWLQEVVWLMLRLFVVLILTLPILWFMHVSAFWWCITLLLTATYTSTVGMAAALWKQQDDFRFWRFLVFQLSRILSFIPLSWTTSSLQAHSLHLSLWLLPLVIAAAVWVLSRMQRRLSWNPLFRTNASPVLNFAGASDPASHQVAYSMRAPSQWLVRGIERTIHRSLSPVPWLLLLRALRTKGVWRTYLSLSAGAVFALRFVGSGPIKLLGAGFFIFLLYQYWKLNIRPLVRKPSMEQTIVEWPVLTVTEVRIFVWILLITLGLWVLMWQLHL
ncbi:hypothetical protein [Alicyclobacillus sp. SO9]|uniref:hypothetical protein n=1 Tax=Alicyclobacillus sp. SO9 TaxID=2665646 RepID=UPI0018E8BE49|nr:hypothetical protein [Alicyclobacillus sp. SO9]QQE77883.1 hypothetical protein GI364_18490 [Alicyclobacillus sp. SO9]